MFVQSPRQFAQLLREKATQTRQSATMPPCLSPPCLSSTSTLPCEGVFSPTRITEEPVGDVPLPSGFLWKRDGSGCERLVLLLKWLQFYQSWRTKNVADGVSERKGRFCFTAVWLCQVGTLPWTVCNGTMTPRTCRPSCQLEASDTSSHSNVVVFHGLFPRQSFGSLVSVVCWKST